MSIKTANTLTPKIFLPYQVAWLKDKSQIKLWRKSRRIGATYVQAFEDVIDALTLKIRGKVCDVWFSSADITAAKEYIMYCAYWAKVLNIAVEDLGEIVIDEKKGVKALSIEFTNGARINALSSNPSQFRSKGGKIVLDEFAHHKDAQALWTAASASAIVWGYPVRILSTDNGQSCKFYQFVRDILRGRLKWSLHKTDIFDAVNQGLADKVKEKELTKDEREEYIQFLKDNAGDEFTWLQEYCCTAVDETSAFLSYELIASCYEDCLRPLENITGDIYVGMDIGRKKDLTHITVLEKLDSVKYMRKGITLKNTRFRDQKKILYSILKHKNFRRAAIDATGIGAQLAEDAQIDFGKSRVYAVQFTGKAKEEMAYNMRMEIEDRNVRYPDDEALREDFHSVKKIQTDSNVIRFDVDSAHTDGHADRFWSMALALFAAIKKKFNNPKIKTSHNRIKSRNKFRDEFSTFKGYLRRGCH